MSDNTENKGKLEQFHLRGRNYDAVVRQLVDKYNSGEGWAVVRVVPSILSLDVYLERNEVQGKAKVAEPKLETKLETKVSPKAKVDVEVVDEKEKPTVAKKATTTNKTAAKK